jgi:ABC-type sugar transport system ATPase subunit
LRREREAATVGVRPEDLRLGVAEAGAAALRGEVTLVEQLGSESLAHVRVDDGPAGADTFVVAKLAGDAGVAVGQAIELHISTSACHLFDASGKAIEGRR